MKEMQPAGPLVFAGGAANRIGDKEVRSGYFLNKMTQNVFYSSAQYCVCHFLN